MLTAVRDTKNKVLEVQTTEVHLTNKTVLKEPKYLNFKNKVSNNHFIFKSHEKHSNFLRG